MEKKPVKDEVKDELLNDYIHLHYGLHRLSLKYEASVIEVRQFLVDEGVFDSSVGGRPHNPINNLNWE